MKYITLLMIIVSFISMVTAIWMNDWRVAMWSFNAGVWAGLYGSKLTSNE